MYKINPSTGAPTWSGRWGSVAGNVLSEGLVLHPSKNLFCGFIAFNGAFGANCDLDFTAGANNGEPSASPGTSSNYWSLFAYCQNTSSNTVLPPTWTHTISSSDSDGGLTFTANPQNTWADNDILIQGVIRTQQFTPQGLVWPASGTKIYHTMNRTPTNI